MFEGRQERELTLDLKSKLAGKFIVFDGPDGSGKSTQLRMLADKATAAGLEIVCGKDPGGTVIGDRIRSVLLDHDLSDMDVRCETFLFMASRAQLVSEVIDPALKVGQVVLCDRFISATCAYQGAAGYYVQRIIDLGRYAIGDTWPWLTIVVDVPSEVGFARMGGRKRDAMERRPMEFHRRVRDLFLSLPGTYPGMVRVVDGTAEPDSVHEAIVEVLERVDA